MFGIAGLRDDFGRFVAEIVGAADVVDVALRQDDIPGIRLGDRALGIAMVRSFKKHPGIDDDIPLIRRDQEAVRQPFREMDKIRNRASSDDGGKHLARAGLPDGLSQGGNLLSQRASPVRRVRISRGNGGPLIHRPRRRGYAPGCQPAEPVRTR